MFRKRHDVKSMVSLVTVSMGDCGVIGGVALLSCAMCLTKTKKLVFA